MIRVVGRRRLIWAAAVLLLIAAAPSAAGLAARNIARVQLLRALPCSDQLQSCLVEMAALWPRRVERLGVRTLALRIGPSDRVVIQLDGKDQRSSEWTPRRGTISLWVMPLAEPAAADGGEHMYLSSDNGALQLYATAAELQFVVAAPDTANSYRMEALLPAAGLSPGSWHHIAATWDWEVAERWALALDGKVVSAGRKQVGAPSAPRPVKVLGLSHYYPTGGHQSVGLIDDVAVYREALTSEQLSAVSRMGSSAREAVPAGVLLFSTRTDARFQAQVDFRLRVLLDP